MQQVIDGRFIKHTRSTLSTSVIKTWDHVPWVIRVQYRVGLASATFNHEANLGVGIVQEECPTKTGEGDVLHSFTEGLKWFKLIVNDISLLQLHHPLATLYLQLELWLIHFSYDETGAVGKKYSENFQYSFECKNCLHCCCMLYWCYNLTRGWSTSVRTCCQTCDLAMDLPDVGFGLVITVSID